MSSESQYLASKYKCKCNTTKNGTTKMLIYSLAIPINLLFL